MQPQISAPKLPDSVALHQQEPLNADSIQLLNYPRFNLFPDTVSAHRAALRYLYDLTNSRGQNVEYGMEIIPSHGGTIKLGKVVVGDPNSVIPDYSDNNPAQKFIGRTGYSSAHSHPYAGRDTRGFSFADLAGMLLGRPLGGRVTDSVISRGQGYMISLDARVKIPTEVQNNLWKSEFLSQSDSDFTLDWIRRMIYENKLTVTLITRPPNDNLPPAFSFDVRGPLNRTQRYHVPSGFIKVNTGN